MRINKFPLINRVSIQLALMLVLAPACLALSGCAAFIRPINGINAANLDPSFSTPTRAERKTIDLALLRQLPPVEHLVDSGDVLGVFIEGILGKLEEAPPIYQPAIEGSKPALGYPVTVLANGAISLPLIDPVYVRGMSILQVQHAISAAYTQGHSPLLQPHQARLIVTLQQPRSYRVLVIRQESDNSQGNLGASESVNFEADKQGTGRIVSLPAYQNDVLHALAETGGLPGLDALNIIYIIRQSRVNQPVIRAQNQDAARYAPPSKRRKSSQRISHANYTAPAHPNRPSHTIRQLTHSYRSSAPAQRPSQQVAIPNAVPQFMPANKGHYENSLPQVSQRNPIVKNSPSFSPQNAFSSHDRWPHGNNDHGEITNIESINSAIINGPFSQNSNIIKIPVRNIPGESLPFSPADIILYDGDIVFIESREKEFFYTGGLLGGGQYTLPRDYDINIIDAISIAETRTGQTAGNPKSIGGPSVLNQDVSVGASLAVIVRQVPGKGQMRIRVNLYQAMNDPHQQVMIKPGDRIYLRYSQPEAMFAFLERHLLQGALLGSTVGTFSN